MPWVSHLLSQLFTWQMLTEWLPPAKPCAGCRGCRDKPTADPTLKKKPGIPQKGSGDMAPGCPKPLRQNSSCPELPSLPSAKLPPGTTSARAQAS